MNPVRMLPRNSLILIHIGLDARKPVFYGLQTMAQASLSIRKDWSAPLLFFLMKVSYLSLTQVKFQFSS